MEFCNLGNLQTYISKSGGRLNEQEARYFLRQLTAGVLFLHDRSIIHRDLKTENILLSGNTDKSHRPILKISDFGIADWTDEISAGPTNQGAVGTLMYVAPEILKKQPHDGRSDIWSLGIIFFEMLQGAPPFAAAKSLDRLLKLIIESQPDPLPPPSIELSTDAKNLLSKTLRREPSDRIDGVGLRSEKYLNLEYVPGPLSEARGMSLLNDAETLKKKSSSVEDKKTILTLYADALSHLMSFLDYLGPLGAASEKGTIVRKIVEGTLKNAEEFRSSFSQPKESSQINEFSSYYTTLKQFGAAMPWFKAILGLENNDIQCAREGFRRGLSLESQGKSGEALAELEEALTILFGAISKETDSSRRAELESEMRTWLKHAENLKASSGQAKSRPAPKRSGLINFKYQSSALDISAERSLR
ncbi:Serine/threonine-protein kinase ulk3 [Dinochytrium kinnereticum]|nr:Serine/threonine-protein kinase ulk3 [Dinochytrium kinnereticum]